MSNMEEAVDHWRYCTRLKIRFMDRFKSKVDSRSEIERTGDVVSNKHD